MDTSSASHNCIITNIHATVHHKRYVNWSHAVRIQQFTIKMIQLKISFATQSFRYGLHWLTHWCWYKNGYHFAMTFPYIFSWSNSDQNFTKVCSYGQTNSIPTLVQIMAWCWHATNHYPNQWWSVYWHIYASLGLNELRAPLWGVLQTWSNLRNVPVDSSIHYGITIGATSIAHVF